MKDYIEFTDEQVKSYRKILLWVMIISGIICLFLIIWTLKNGISILSGDFELSHAAQSVNHFIFFRKVDETRQSYILISLPLMILITASFLRYLLSGGLTRTELWAFVYQISFTFLLGAGFIAFLEINFYKHDGIEEPIFNQKDQTIFEENQKKQSLKEKSENPLFVPTGIFVQSIEFISANNVKLTGYVWQKYTKVLHDSLSRGFIVPEAESSSITEAYSTWNKDSTVETKGWYFEATLRENFDYSNYPFDIQNVWFRLWHKDFSKNVILSPDFVSYKDPDPIKLPGIDSQMVLPGWNTETSFFSYNYNSYNTNFGIENYSGQNHFPELYFNIFIKRAFLASLVTDIVPILLVLLLMFLTFEVTYANVDDDFFKFNMVESLSLGAALLFVLTLSQYELRNKIPSGSILYIEYVYFAVYAGIIWVMGYSILSRVLDKLPFFMPQNGLIAKLIFLPIMATVIYIITFLKFY